MSARLANKTALVTGATSNIGRAIAVAFAAEGAQVAASGRSHERGREVTEEIRAAGGHADFLTAHLDGSARASEDLAHEAVRVLGGRIDVLVNSAGIYPGLSTAATDEAIFDEVYAVNVKAPFFLVAAIAPAMAENGGGAIINLGSWIARIGIPVGSLYSSTKGAIETLTRAWAAEFGRAGVRVNAISPGVIRSPTPPPARWRCRPRGRADDARHAGRRQRHARRHCARGCVPGQRRVHLRPRHGDRRRRRPGEYRRDSHVSDIRPRIPPDGPTDR